jgi:glycosyltransferase involved in cell wall biosynthesis
MSSHPLVSVVMIFLNAEQFIQEAIASIFAQTYPRWELLLVDDGSSDASTQIARRHADRNPEQVRYLEHAGHQNQGMSASRNLGLGHANGEYIAFLDADDAWLPHKLEQQTALLAAQPTAGMLYGRTKYWHGWTGLTEDRSRDFVPAHGIHANALYQPCELLPRYLRGEAAIPSMCSVLVRRDLLQRVNGFEDAFRGLMEDQVFYAKVCLQAPVFVSDECWDLYRQHAGSSCAVAERNGLIHRAQLAYLGWLEQYLLEHRIYDIHVWRAFRKAQWQQRHRTLAWLARSARRRMQWLRSLSRQSASVHPVHAGGPSAR